jgi:hypothetical protein
MGFDVARCAAIDPRVAPAKAETPDMIDSFPPTRRAFAHEWDEIEYLYYKMLYWAYGRNDDRRAGRFSNRLQRLLDRFDPDCKAILGESARALIADVNGKPEDAIRFRSREIELMEKLIRMGPPADYQLGPEDVSDRMDLLAIHYWDAGNLRKARETLEACRQYCRKHRIPFDGQDILDDVLKDQTDISHNGKNGVHGKRRQARPDRVKAAAK